MKNWSFRSILIYATILCVIFTVANILMEKFQIGTSYSTHDFKLWMYDAIVLIGWVVYFLKKEKD